VEQIILTVLAVGSIIVLFNLAVLLVVNRHQLSEIVALQSKCNRWQQLYEEERKRHAAANGYVEATPESLCKRQLPTIS
jgi:hypothetical protein